MTLHTLTVGQLIHLLEQEDSNAPVIFSSNYGDRTRTEQAHAIEGRLEEVTLRKSGYSDSGFAVMNPDDTDEVRQAYDKLTLGKPKTYVLIK